MWLSSDGRCRPFPPSWWWFAGRRLHHQVTLLPPHLPPPPPRCRQRCPYETHRTEETNVWMNERTNPVRSSSYYWSLLIGFTSIGLTMMVRAESSHWLLPSFAPLLAPSPRRWMERIRKTPRITMTTRNPTHTMMMMVAAPGTTGRKNKNHWLSCIQNKFNLKDQCAKIFSSWQQFQLLIYATNHFYLSYCAAPYIDTAVYSCLSIYRSQH